MPNLPPSTRRCTTATGAHGFDTDHWTLAQITTVIQRLTGVAYHRGHVGKLLSHAGTIAPSAPPAARSSATSRPSPARWPRTSRRICRGARGGVTAPAFHHQVNADDTQTLIGALGELHRSLAGRRRPGYGTGCPPTAARQGVPGSAVSGPGWSWSHCPATRPTSTRSRR